jgi:cob(I)alamin adenosyltransferase
MSIATKTGDKGYTGLLFGEREKKSAKIFEAVGNVDELNASIGMLKATILDKLSGKPFVAFIEEVQHRLTLYMGELVAEPQNREKYVQMYDSIKEADLEQLDMTVKTLEKDPNTKQSGWVLYGNSTVGSTADFASKVCRRAERSVVYLDPEHNLRPILLQYINRLSDVLHLLGRYFDGLQKIS